MGLGFVSVASLAGVPGRAGVVSSVGGLPCPYVTCCIEGIEGAICRGIRGVWQGRAVATHCMGVGVVGAGVERAHGVQGL